MNKFNDIYKEPNSAPWTFPEVAEELKEIVSSNILPSGGKVLEIGCGEGYHSIFFAKQGFDVTALDTSNKAILFAQHNADEQSVRVDFRVGDYMELSNIKESYDFIFDWRFLHEIVDDMDRENYIQLIYHLLSSKGKYLSVAFSGDSDFMGTGTIRLSPVGIPIFFSSLIDSIELLKRYNLKILNTKHIMLPQKPNLLIMANYLLVEK